MQKHNLDTLITSVATFTTIFQWLLKFRTDEIEIFAISWHKFLMSSVVKVSRLLLWLRCYGQKNIICDSPALSSYAIMDILLLSENSSVACHLFVTMSDTMISISICWSSIGQHIHSSRGL